MALNTSKLAKAARTSGDQRAESQIVEDNVLETAETAPAVVDEKKEESEGSAFYPFLDNLKDIKITSKFKEKIDPFGTGSYEHDGVDFGVPVGTPVYAPFSGIVTIPSEGYEATGNTVILSTTYGTFTFGHLSKISVVEGTIEKGALLGYSGGGEKSNPKELTTGPHLHVKYVNLNGVSTDPLQLYKISTVYDVDDVVGEITTDAAPDWLQILGVTTLSVVGAVLVVGILSEAIQAMAYRKALDVDAEHPLIASILYTIAKIPGLKHIDWKNCRIDGPMPRKALFSQLKRLDYARTEICLGIQDQNGSLKGFETTRLSDVDFTDVIRLRFSNGYTLFATSVAQISLTSLASTDIPLQFKGYLVSDTDEVLIGGCEIGTPAYRTVSVYA